MRFAILALFSLGAIAASAQFNDLNKRKPWEDFKKKYNYKVSPGTKLAPKATDLPEGEQQDPGVKKLPLKGKHIGTNDKGDDIYAMQPHNMPCLVPSSSFRSNMPVGKYQKDLRLNKEKQQDNSN